MPRPVAPTMVPRAGRYTHEVGGSGQATRGGEVLLDGAWRAMRRAGRVVESTSGQARSAGIKLPSRV